jgi:NitT/TauT family transport system permease protein/putative hydroxymethylpyrimidine transport system permease protein
MSETPRRRWLSWAGTITAILLLLIVWEGFARFAGLDKLLVAGPVDVARTFGDESGLLATNAWVTAREALLGLLLACVVGVAFGLALHLSPFLRDATMPLIVGSQAVPTVVLAPLLVIAFGFGIGPKLIIVAIACFFPITVGTFDGLRSSDPQLLLLMESLGASRWRRLRLAELPASLPRMLSGMRIAATWAFISAVFAEYAGSDSGLGYLIARGTPSFQTSRVFAAVLILTLASLALYGLLALVERRFVPWERHSANQR